MAVKSNAASLRCGRPALPVLALLAALQLAACAEGTRGPAPTAAEAKPTAPVTEPVVPPNAAPPPRAAAQDEPKVARAVPPKPAPAPRPSLPPLALKTLIGLDQGQASRLIGTPTSIYEQPPAIVWEYRGTSCALTLNFYLEVQQKAYRVLNLRVAGTDGTPPAEQACLDGIRGSNLTQN